MKMPKFHIYPNKESYDALYWDSKLIEFDTEVAAKDFVRCCIDTGACEVDFFNEFDVRHDIVYNDDGYLNATFLRPQYGSEGLYSIEGRN